MEVIVGRWRAGVMDERRKKGRSEFRKGDDGADKQLGGGEEAEAPTSRRKHGPARPGVASAMAHKDDKTGI